jgi:hypothetical protein
MVGGWYPNPSSGPAFVLAPSKTAEVELRAIIGVFSWEIRELDQITYMLGYDDLKQRSERHATCMPTLAGRSTPTRLAR